MTSVPIAGVSNWHQFEKYAQHYLSHLWRIDLQKRSVTVADKVAWTFDIVSEDRSMVGDAKWLKNIKIRLPNGKVSRSTSGFCRRWTRREPSWSLGMMWKCRRDT